MKSCLFHFGQTIFKNLIYYFKNEACFYLNDPKLQKRFERLFTLALLPLD